MPQQVDDTGDATRAFAYGYIASNRSIPGDLVDGWRTAGAGGFTWYFHPLTDFAVVAGETQLVAAVLIGQAVDLNNGIVDLNQIASTVARTYKAEGQDAAVRYVAYLGGRFTCYLVTGEGLTVVPDCTASQSTYWHTSSDVLTVATHPNLIAVARGLEFDEETTELVRLREEVNNELTVHLPALKTAFVDVRPLLANSLLAVEWAPLKVAHRRFYPWTEVEPRDPPDAYESFLESYVEHVRLLLTFGSIGVSLTSGLDSGATFAAATSLPRPGDFFAFTYTRLAKHTDEARADLLGANRRAFDAGVRHLVVRTDKPEPNPSFDVLFDTTFRGWGQARTIARAMYEDLPHAMFEFYSTVAEIGSAFYKNREPAIYDPKRLASVYGGSPDMSESGLAVRAFEDYIAYAEFEPERSLGLDGYDLFYWEHRLSRWAANRYHENDLGHRVLLPFNSRATIEAMLSGPYETRLEKAFQRVAIRTLSTV